MYVLSYLGINENDIINKICSHLHSGCIHQNNLLIFYNDIEGNAHQNIKGFSSEGAPQVILNLFYTREATFKTRHADWQEKDDILIKEDILEAQPMVGKHFFSQGIVFHFFT